MMTGTVRAACARRATWIRMSLLLLSCAVAAGCAGHKKHGKYSSDVGYRRGLRPAANAPSLETIYVLRSVREPHRVTPNGCARSVTGFEPLEADGERFYSFWSVRTRPDDGSIDDAHVARVGTLRGCFGATEERARQHFYAEIDLGDIPLIGRGECLGLALDTPEAGLIPARCQLRLSPERTPYVGGVLTTNTMASKAAFGGSTDPVGYTQASIATIRLWKAR